MKGEKKNFRAVTWLIQKSKPQIFSVVLLIIGKTLLASTAVFFALICRGVIDGAVGHNKRIFLLYALGLLGIILLQLALRLFCRSFEEKIKAKLEMLYKTDLFQTLLDKGYPQVTKYHSGELLNRLTNDVVIISEGITTLLPNLFSMMTRLFCALGVLILFDRLFALVFLCGGILLFLVSKIFRRKLKDMHKTVQEKDGKVRSFLQEALGSLIVVKVFNIQKKMVNKSVEVQKELYQAKMKRRTVSILANTGFGFIFQLGYLYALLWGAFCLYGGTMSFGSLTAILQLVGQVQQPFTSLSGFLPRYYSVIASVERMIEMEDLPEDKGSQINRDTKALYKELRQIQFKHITFRYDREILFDDASLSIQKHDFVVIEGVSGIGKSTLLKLLLGLYPDYEGEIYLSAGKLGNIPVDRSTRGLFGYVPQGNYLFSGTIRENITMICPEASVSQIKEAIRISCVDQFIDQLPEGLDTMIGEKGQGLSEGQIQRIAIARMLLSGAPVLLLDEATSALDEKTEEKLLRNLQELSEFTLIIVSHKKAARRICNKRVQIIRNKLICKSCADITDG
ncbi:MAG: ABC transporter ATP-binding protein [Clostridiales bacterium]|nr:ABC transporter ATP-binding protein [Clostridiales bacterium]